MTRPLSAFLLPCIAFVVAAQSPAEKCVALNKKLKAVYSVRRSQASDDVMRKKLAETDDIWSLVQKDPSLRPCILEAVEAPGANPFLQLDGAFLLLESDHASAAYKDLFVRVASRLPIEEVWNDEMWMYFLMALGAEGYDISKAAQRWLEHPGRTFTQSTHVYEVNYESGLIFLFGSMEERHAFPILLKTANDLAHPGRKAAIYLLARLGTPESWAALRTLDGKGLDKNAARFLRSTQSKTPDLLQPKSGALTRAQLLERIEGWSKRHYFPTRHQMLENDSDYALHWANVLTAEDLPLLRTLRRNTLATFREDALDYYLDFSAIILRLTWSPAPGATGTPQGTTSAAPRG